MFVCVCMLLVEHVGCRGCMFRVFSFLAFLVVFFCFFVVSCVCGVAGAVLCLGGLLGVGCLRVCLWRCA